MFGANVPGAGYSSSYRGNTISSVVAGVLLVAGLGIAKCNGEPTLEEESNEQFISSPEVVKEIEETELDTLKIISGKSE